MSLETTIEQYYHSPKGMELAEYVSQAGATKNNVHRLVAGPLRYQDQEALDPQQVAEALDEVSHSLRVIGAGGSSFEIATANNATESDGVMLHVSTYSSAISTNPGNAYEFAAQAVRYPNKKHLYVASFGNGGSAPLLPADAAYARETGRFVREENGIETPLQSIHNLHAALEKEGLAVTRIMGTDSAGGHYARALTVAMGPGQLSHAFFSETTGFVNLSLSGIAYAMLFREGVQNAKRNRALSPDPEMVDGSKKAWAKQALEKYEDSSRRQELRDASVSTKASLKNMWNSAQALRRGPRGQKNPLLQDMNAVLARHPQAHITFGIADEDPLYRSIAISHIATKRLLGELAVQSAPVRALIIPGMTHAYNTYFPSLYHAVKKYALEK